jgi:hypothetical protein
MTCCVSESTGLARWRAKHICMVFTSSALHLCVTRLCELITVMPKTLHAHTSIAQQHKTDRQMDRQTNRQTRTNRKTNKHTTTHTHMARVLHLALGAPCVAFCEEASKSKTCENILAVRSCEWDPTSIQTACWLKAETATEKLTLIGIVFKLLLLFLNT